MLSSLIWTGLVVCVLFLISKQAAALVWTTVYALIALLYLKYGSPEPLSKFTMGMVFIGFLIFAIKPLRQKLLSRFLFARISKAMPVMSSTEKEALEAGTVSWEGEIFSGSPNFDKLYQTPAAVLTEAEQAFMDGPLKELCRMIDDWEITHKYTDLPPELWQFIKENGFLGMIIPKEYGGHGFSATAQIQILSTVYGRSISVATTISVPNSLGPAELLLKYGTQAQKDYYLPRLANGREIPCFALTGPTAGSDAASIPDMGIVCRQLIDDKEVTGIRLNWNKRYITLCPVATVIGLAFRLFDPDNLLKQGEDLGITCALIPANTPGVIRGRRHFPLNTAFLNGPTQGKNVFIPMDYLIGGVEMAGAGWRMLMECLSAGRAISLPSSAMGGAQAAALASGAYARVRKQFSQAIGQFEGIEEPLARIAANTYIIDAGLTMAAADIDAGARPSVAGAILKYHTTERGRQVSSDAMDIHGGKGICLGPKNYLGRGFQNAPIAITVEGANILTRSLIIFGQGAVRCHPYVFKEMESVRTADLQLFDEAFWGHASFILANFVKSLIFSLTGARFTHTPTSRLHRSYQLIHKYSTRLAFASDFSMMMLGSRLKRKEKLSARLGDVLSCLYLASAVLKRFQRDGEPLDDLPLVEWCCQHLFFECEVAFAGLIANFPGRFQRLFLRLVISPWGFKGKKPSDALGRKTARLLMEPCETRQRLTRFVFTESLENCPLGRLESAFQKIYAVTALERILTKAVRDGHITSLTALDQITEALEKGVLDVDEAARLRDAEKARQEAIAVDDFADEALRRQTVPVKTDAKENA